MVAGVLALAMTVALAVVGVAPDGGHTWIHSIQAGLNSVMSNVSQPTGGHTWIH